MRSSPFLRRATRAVVFTACVGAAVAPLAARAASRAEQEHACRRDALRLCANDVPNKARITACMKAHYDQLSPRCQAMFDQPETSARPKS